MNNNLFVRPNKLHWKRSLFNPYRIEINLRIKQINHENTFVVIIGNQEYEHEIRVAYALNDAGTF